MLNFTFVSLYMVLSGITGTDVPAPVIDTAEQQASTIKLVQLIEEKRNRFSTKELSEIESFVLKNKDDLGEVTEAYVKSLFSDTPVLADIAFCESTYRHFDKNGKVLRGIVNDKDVGLMQINEYYHIDSSKRLGLDIHTLEGNVAYARHLYEEYGTSPWSASKPCWSKKVAVR